MWRDKEVTDSPYQCSMRRRPDISLQLQQEQRGSMCAMCSLQNHGTHWQFQVMGDITRCTLVGRRCFVHTSVTLNCCKGFSAGRVRKYKIVCKCYQLLIGRIRRQIRSPARIREPAGSYYLIIFKLSHGLRVSWLRRPARTTRTSQGLHIFPGYCMTSASIPTASSECCKPATDDASMRSTGRCLRTLVHLERRRSLD